MGVLTCHLLSVGRVSPEYSACYLKALPRAQTNMNLWFRTLPRGPGPVEERRELFKQWFECGIDTGSAAWRCLGPQSLTRSRGLAPEELAWTCEL